MVAAVERKNGFCVVYWTGRQGLSVNTITYCDEKGSAGDGVVQIAATQITCETCKANVLKRTGKAIDA